MTTILDDNVHNVAVDGSFDDCQAMVKVRLHDINVVGEWATGSSVTWRLTLSVARHCHLPPSPGPLQRPRVPRQASSCSHQQHQLGSHSCAGRVSLCVSLLSRGKSFPAFNLFSFPSLSLFPILCSFFFSHHRLCTTFTPTSATWTPKRPAS